MVFGFHSFNSKKEQDTPHDKHKYGRCSISWWTIENEDAQRRETANRHKENSYREKDRTVKQSWLLRFRKSPPHTQTNIVCTAIIMVATIAYVIIAGFQLSAMQGTLAEMKRSGEQSTAQMWSAISNINWMARSMDWSQKTTQKGIQASDRQSRDALQAAINQFRSEQRAWVGVSPVNLTHPIQDSPIRGISFYTENSGRTPANSVLLIVGFYVHRGLESFAPNDEDRTFMEKMVTGFKNGTLSQELMISKGGLRSRKDGPNGPDGPTPFAPTIVNIGTMPPNVPFPVPYEMEIGIAGARGILYGRIYYEDMAKKARTTSFCYYSPDIQSLERIFACPVFNNMN